MSPKYHAFVLCLCCRWLLLRCGLLWRFAAALCHIRCRELSLFKNMHYAVLFFCEIFFFLFCFFFFAFVEILFAVSISCRAVTLSLRPTVIGPTVHMPATQQTHHFHLVCSVRKVYSIAIGAPAAAIRLA